MIIVNILSDDILYARMLMHEIKSLCGKIGGTPDVFVNKPMASLNGNIPCILVLDLDSKYSTADLSSPFVIGFSSYDEVENSKKYSFCREIFVRPFSISDFATSVGKIVLELSGDVDDQRSDRRHEITLAFGEDNNIVFCGNRLHLSKNEYDILYFLNGKQSELVSRDEINRILGGECGNMCDVYICRLRGKLSAFSNEKLIYTVRNKGYMLKLK